MPKTMILLSPILTAAFAFASPALAQEIEWDIDMAPEVDHFAVSDADADGVINRSEFTAYVDSRAASGDEDYILIQSSGDLARYFTEKDTNADAVLEKDELTPIPIPEPADDMNKNDEETLDY